MDGLRAVVAVIIVIVFAVFGYFLVVNADTKDATEWERWVYVFGAAEAIAFTAIGWMFGREVNRQRAENAEGNAKKAQDKAEAEQGKGAILAGMVAEAAAAGGDVRGLEKMGPGGGAGGGGLTAAAKFAREKYDL